MAKRGETREVILKAATKVFFENGFEKTSVKMILSEANIVTGSFYHFFPSKEALFEAVVEEFLKEYSDRIKMLLEDDTLSITQIMDGFFDEFAHSTETYFNVLQADRLHWTVKCALHDMTIESMVEPMTHALDRLLEEGSVKSRLDEDAEILARILIKGSEVMIHSPEFGRGEMQSMENLRNSLNDFWKLVIEF
ncbi:MAG: TetR/AcrR family transcriptional regulator [Lachnospiraceae bacterium]|nr:TetR/AcrR family transcriptional regulator [Lachnospiraceae bacterium]